MISWHGRAGFSALLFAVMLAAGCATNKIDWAGRVGSYTHDQAVLDFGPPDKTARLTDGSMVEEWMTNRGHLHGVINYPGYYAYGPAMPMVYSSAPSPDYFLRLVFGLDGKLKDWKRVAK